jgi:branched-chain amino acid transport system ATP-binding protein
MTSLLAATGLRCGYGHVNVVEDIDLHVDANEVVALLGPNGAGKTTVLRTLFGEIPELGGRIMWQGEALTGPAHKRAQRGLCLIPAERGIFGRLSVLENLRVARVEPGDVLAFFPELERCLKRKAGLLSGGEQQMLAIGRAIARKPRVLLIDELSLGLAPMIVERLLRSVRKAANEGMGVILVEQHLGNALSIADSALVMSRGRIELSASASDVKSRLSEVEALYFGGSNPPP